MLQEIVISGFGGQGVLSMGKILAYSGIMEDKEVVWYPAYGPEQRGGTAYVSVIVSDAIISSPVGARFDVAIVLNQPSMLKFEERVKPGGILIYEDYGIHTKVTRKDIHVYKTFAMEEATKLNNLKVFNMIVLGGLLKVVPLVGIENVMLSLKKTLPERHHSLLPANREAILKGMEIIEQEQVATI